MTQHVHEVLSSPFKVENTEVARRILNDPVAYTAKFSKESKAICEGLMEKDPVKRLGFKNNDCEELKNQPFFKDINWGRLEAGMCHNSIELNTTQLGRLGLQMQLMVNVICRS